MKGCEVSENTVIGKACRLTPGTGPEACHLWQAVGSESGETAGLLGSLISSIPGCPFRQRALERIKLKKAQQPGGGFLSTMRDISQIGGLAAELHGLNDGLDRLNDNLGKLTPSVPIFLALLARLAVGVEDLVDVVAPFSGRRAVREKK